MLFRRITTAGFFVVSIAGIPAYAQPIMFRTVAFSGHQVIGYEEGVRFGLLGSPSINDHGQVAFAGNLIGRGVNSTNDQAVFSEGGDIGLASIARKGDQAQGVQAGINYDLFQYAKINNDSQVVFLGNLAGVGVDAGNNRVLYSQRPDTGMNLLARQGEQAAGAAPGVVYDLFIDEHHLNDSGNVSFASSLAGPSVNNFNRLAAYQQDSTGGLTPLIREGDEAQGAGQSVRYESFHIPQINDNGTAAFVARLTGNATGASNDDAIFRSDFQTGVPTAVVREGNQAPGLAAGVVLGSMNSTVINDHGRVAFNCWLRGAGDNDLAIYRDNPNNDFTLVAQRGKQVPALDHGITYKSMNATTINNAGDVVFMSSLEGDSINTSNDYAIFSNSSDGEQTLIARHGQQAPGLEPGVYLGSFPFSTERSIRLNNRGQVAFFAGTSQGGQGLFATDLNGELQLVIAEGMVIDVNNDAMINEFRTIQNIYGNDIEFSDTGELVFRAEFSNGADGIVVATIPAPGSACLVAIAGGVLCRRNRK